jgi:hypothetical protein
VIEIKMTTYLQVNEMGSPSLFVPAKRNFGQRCWCILTHIP